MLRTRIPRCALGVLDAAVSILLNLVLAKPISIFVWWLHAWANHTTFHHRAELARRIRGARRAGNPVLFASNHLSMFDDPVVPMALFRTGPRAVAELSGLVGLLLLWRVTPSTAVPPEVALATLAAYSLGISLLGARKTWWSIGDMVNFSGVSALRGKMESGRDRPLSLPARILLAVLDPLVFFFMRSATVKTVLVDRRSGAEGNRSRVRAAERGVELAARGGQLWIFFEGGRTRVPDEIRPARSGIGQVIKGLQALGIRPVVIAIHHRGLEHVIPISSRRWLTSGHRIDIRWSEFAAEGRGVHDLGERDAQEIADDIRAAVVRLQSDWRSEHASGV
jgi:1-acyl-sn-glycerol-3-phosphate acyltransferase